MLVQKETDFFVNNYEKEEIKHENLLPGVYKIDVKQYGLGTELYFKELKLEIDNLVKIESGVFKEIYDHVNNFFSGNTKEIYEDFKIKYKSASLLYGSPGTGKTCLIQMILNNLVQNNKAICIYGSPDTMCIMAKYARKDENIPLIFVLEEIDGYINKNSYSTGPTIEKLLNFLDGFESVNNIYVLATTNHIKNIGDNFIKRPSRFERKFNLEKIPSEVIFHLVPKMIPQKYHNKFDIKKLAYELSEKDFKIDQLKNILIKYIQGNDLKTCIEMFSYDDLSREDSKVEEE